MFGNNLKKTEEVLGFGFLRFKGAADNPYDYIKYVVTLEVKVTKIGGKVITEKEYMNFVKNIKWNEIRKDENDIFKSHEEVRFKLYETIFDDNLHEHNSNVRDLPSGYSGILMNKELDLGYDIDENILSLYVVAYNCDEIKFRKVKTVDLIDANIREDEVIKVLEILEFYGFEDTNKLVKKHQR